MSRALKKKKKRKKRRGTIFFQRVCPRSGCNNNTQEETICFPSLLTVKRGMTLLGLTVYGQGSLDYNNLNVSLLLHLVFYLHPMFQNTLQWQKRKRASKNNFPSFEVCCITTQQQFISYKYSRKTEAANNKKLFTQSNFYPQNSIFLEGKTLCLM